VNEESVKDLVERAVNASGQTVEELADRMGYATLPRVAKGEFPLPESKRLHLLDIIRISELEKAVATKLVVTTPEDDHVPLMSRRGVGRPSMRPREKLRFALSERGMTPAQLADKMVPKYDRGIIENVVNGAGKMSVSMAEGIVAVLPELSMDDLLGGSDTPRIFGSDVYATVGEKPVESLIPGLMERAVPLLSWAAAGATSSLDFLDDSYDSTAVRTTVQDRKAFAVTVSGDSMIPEFKPGDHVVVSPSSRPELGKPVIVRTVHGDVLCKFFQTKDGGKVVILSSVNSNYSPIEIPMSEIAWIYPIKEVRRNY